MRGAVVIALCVTGCFSDRGVAIEVDIGTTSATSVELYIGKEACADDRPAGVGCATIIPPGATVSLGDGDVWFRDAPSRYTADVKGHTATFQLKAADTAITLPVVIAVGFASSGETVPPVGTAVLRDLAIPLNNARIVTTTMVPANPVLPRPADPKNATEDRVTVWTKATSPSSCVVVEHWERGQPVKRDFVVPRSDPDCDGFLDMSDCNANAFDSSNAGGQAPTPNCFAGGPVGTCLLGSLGCVDGVGSTPGTCAPQSTQHDQEPVCVPSQFCAATCTNIGPECTQDVIKNAALIPHIVCHVPVRTDGAACPTDNSAPIVLDSYYTSTATCDQQPQLSSLQIATLPTITNSQHFGGAVMELGSPSPFCHFSITWKNGIRTVQDPPTDFGVIQLQTGGRSTLLPIVFQFESGACITPGQFKCSIAGNTAPSDPLWACAHP